MQSIWSRCGNVIRLLAVLKNTMKWPGRDSPGKGRFLTWHQADLSCQWGSGTTTGSPPSSPWGDLCCGWHPITWFPCVLCKGTPQLGTGHPSPPLPVQPDLQFILKGTDGEGNRAMRGALRQHSTAAVLGRWHPPTFCSDTRAGRGIPVPLGTHQHNSPTTQHPHQPQNWV